MDATERLSEVLREVLDRSHLWQPVELATSVAMAASRAGLRTTIYQVDHEQRSLRALPQQGQPTPEPVPVNGSIGGLAFGSVGSRLAGGDGEAYRWWVPMIDGTDRLGVVEFTLPDDVDANDPGLRQGCERLAGLVGHLIATSSSRGDHLHQMRRSRPMSVASELLWQLLPPLTSSGAQIVVSAVLEPCYEVGGDGFDYSLDGPRASLVVLDAVGKGLKAGLACAVTLAAIRATRRAGHGLSAQARAADAALVEQFTDARFTTGVLAELDLDNGLVRYVNAGHPAPLVLRGGKAVRELSAGRRPPLGIADPTVEIGEERLEPNDRLLFYTDGITEARAANGELFGVSRLADMVEQNAAEGLPTPESVRRLSHAVAAYQDGPYTDDATLMLVEWSAGAAQATVPGGYHPTETSGPQPTGKDQATG